MIAASYQEALTTFRDLLDEGVNYAGYAEYVRGGVNLIADLFPVYQMDIGARIEQVYADLKRIPMNADPFKLDQHGVVYNFFPPEGR